VFQTHRLKRLDHRKINAHRVPLWHEFTKTQNTTKISLRVDFKKNSALGWRFAGSGALKKRVDSGRKERKDTEGKNHFG